MSIKNSLITTILTLISLGLFSQTVCAHGDVTPQAVDASELPPLGEEKLQVNPYRGNEKAIEIGASGYNQNCARCHGLEAVSGGITPDLRKLNNLDDFSSVEESDEWFIYRVREGAVNEGRVYMPPFEGILSQEAMWAIRSYLDTRPYTDN